MLIIMSLCSELREVLTFIMTLGILLLGNLNIDIYIYIEVGIIVKLTISQLKLGNSEFGSSVSKKTACLNCFSLFFVT